MTDYEWQVRRALWQAEYRYCHRQPYGTPVPESALPPTLRLNILCLECREPVVGLRCDCEEAA